MMLLIITFVNRFVVAGAGGRCLVDLYFVYADSFMLSLGATFSIIRGASPLLSLVLPHSPTMLMVMRVMFSPSLVVVSTIIPYPIFSRAGHWVVVVLLVMRSFRVLPWCRILVASEGHRVSGLPCQIRVQGQSSLENLRVLRKCSYRSPVLEELNLFSYQNSCIPLLFESPFHGNHDLVEVFIDIFARVNPNVSPSRLLRDLLNHTSSSSNNLSHQVARDH